MRIVTIIVLALLVSGFFTVSKFLLEVIATLAGLDR